MSMGIHPKLIAADASVDTNMFLSLSAFHVEMAACLLRNIANPV